MSGNCVYLASPLILSLSKDAAPRYSHPMHFWAYLLRCSDGSYYAGHTDQIEGRIALHNAGQIPGYTASRRPVRLMWCDVFPTRDEAFAFERRIKGWGRAKTEALMAGDWDRVSKLARNRQADGG